MSVRSFVVAICTFLVITLGFQGEVRAQNMREIDSMERALKTANDSIKMIIYNYLAHQYRLLGDYDKSIHACEKGLEYSKKVKFKMGIGNSYFNLGLTYWQRQWYSNALSAYDHALEAVADAVTAGDIDKRLGGPAIKPVFAVRG